ncbi:unnamed protein product [Prorocentrum cordatum]|uniref:Uncharacterized protein n=1 Tax=Prorocentrum cordatum TaxID=2364126 RepID=A0ABN9SMD4_9DINO|nr:unnamed protein product [Polarella glacialis]
MGTGGDAGGGGAKFDPLAAVTGSLLGSGGGGDEPEPQQMCAQLQGLFQTRRMKMATSSLTEKAELLMGKEGPEVPAGLPGVEAEDGFYVAHTPTKLWFKCFVFGKGKDSKMRCSAYEPLDNNGSCGWRKCNYSRSTFQTQCIGRTRMTLPLMPSGPEPTCIYTGHNGEAVPKDLMGKPVPYAMYVLGGED